MLNTFVEVKEDEKLARTLVAHHADSGARAAATIMGVCTHVIAPKAATVKSTRSNVEGRCTWTTDAMERQTADTMAETKVATSHEDAAGDEERRAV